MGYSCCTHCVLDNSDSCITFNDQGICNYCLEYLEKEREIQKERQKDFYQHAITQIKKSRGKSGYDCIIGISSGLDSSYLLHLAVKEGLKPLAVHYDCGWNTEKAVSNIETLIGKLKVDLHTYVVEWEEFKDMQLAYLKAGVVDLEVPTDHSFLAALYKTAVKFDVRYILTGHNFVTEGIMPRSWVYNKGDAANLLDIHRRFGQIKRLRSFPVVGLAGKFYYYNIKKIANLHLLNYNDYIKADAARILSEEIGWQPHPVKHGESIWTRFYQCYILPVRFGIDKRKAHLSNLICSGQITRQQAVEELGRPVYDYDLLFADKEFVLKKFGITSEELDRYIHMPLSRHSDYKTDAFIKQAYNFMRSRLGLYRQLKTSYHY